MVLCGVVWYSMALFGIVRYCVGFCGTAWHFVVLCDFVWDWAVLIGILRYCAVFSGIFWYCVILRVLRGN